jgi:hypothetical protein
MNDVSRLALKERRQRSLRLSPDAESFISGVKAIARTRQEVRASERSQSLEDYSASDFPEFAPLFCRAAVEALMRENIGLRARVAELEAEQLAQQQQSSSVEARTRAVLDINRQVAMQFIGDKIKSRAEAIATRESLRRQVMWTEQFSELAEIAWMMSRALQLLLARSMSLRRSVGEGLRSLRHDVAGIAVEIDELLDPSARSGSPVAV